MGPACSPSNFRTGHLIKVYCMYWLLVVKGGAIIGARARATVSALALSCFVLALPNNNHACLVIQCHHNHYFSWLAGCMLFYCL